MMCSWMQKKTRSNVTRSLLTSKDFDNCFSSLFTVIDNSSSMMKTCYSLFWTRFDSSSFIGIKRFVHMKSRVQENTEGERGKILPFSSRFTLPSTADELYSHHESFESEWVCYHSEGFVVRWTDDLFVDHYY